MRKPIAVGAFGKAAYTGHFRRDGIAPAMAQNRFPGQVRQFLARAERTEAFRGNPTLCASLSGIFAAPRALDAIIAQNARVQPVGRALRVLYVGADLYETWDGGAWFGHYQQVEPGFIDVEITAVGPGCADGQVRPPSYVSSALGLDDSSRIVELLPYSLEEADHHSGGQLSRNIESGYYDLAILHHPEGVVDPHNWADDMAFEYLLHSCTPVFGTSFNAVDMAYDALAMQLAGGVLVDPCIAPSPHHRVYDPNVKWEDSRWGHIVWEVLSKAEAHGEGLPARIVDEGLALEIGELLAIRTAARVIEMSGGDTLPREPVPGAWLPTPNPVIEVGLHWVVDVARKQLWHKGATVGAAQLPDDFVHQLESTHCLFQRQALCYSLTSSPEIVEILGPLFDSI